LVLAVLDQHQGLHPEAMALIQFLALYPQLAVEAEALKQVL
jgi:hypothetical protein